MPFRSKLKVMEIIDGTSDHWYLITPLVYQGRWEEFRVPSGFRTDFASVPRIFWFTHPPYGRHTKASVVHDWMYREKPNVFDRRAKETSGVGYVRLESITRKDADGLYLRMMREAGVHWLRRITMYWAVRLFGWSAWKGKKDTPAYTW